MMNASTYVRELCAITSAVKKWRTYLLGRKFIIHTDQRSLRELMTQVIQTPEQHFYLSKLLGYSYEIIYKPGAKNRVANALSRVHGFDSQFMAITIPHWDFLQKLKTEFLSDPSLHELIQRVLTEPDAHLHYSVHNELLFYNGKLYIPPSSSLNHVLLEEFHSSPLGGHGSIHKTYGRMKENVFWHGMKKDVTHFINTCTICQQTKNPTHLPYGLLQPLPIPEGV